MNKAVDKIVDNFFTGEALREFLITALILGAFALLVVSLIAIDYWL
jgi:hypothetical protein